MLSNEIDLDDNILFLIKTNEYLIPNIIVDRIVMNLIVFENIDTTVTVINHHLKGFLTNNEVSGQNLLTSNNK